MHKLAALPGGWNPNTEGVIFVSQSPAPIVFLTYADTDIQTIASARSLLEESFADIRVVNLLNLQQQLSIDEYVETVLSKAQVIVLRLLGGSTYWNYGLERIKEIIEINKIDLFVLPGDLAPDLDLISHSTVSLSVVNQLWRYLIEGGRENFANALQFISDICLHTNYQPPAPKSVPELGFYQWQKQTHGTAKNIQNGDRLSCGILFYRSHYLAGNTLPIDCLCQSIVAKNLTPIPIFVSSLRNIEIQQQLLVLLQEKPIKVLFNSTSFSLAKISESPNLEFWQRLNIPILQVILSSSTLEQWSSSLPGLMPRDVAMNVALPEVDGRIITRAISFKSVQTWNEQLETNVVVYQPQSDRINFVAEVAKNWANLANTANQDKKVALILANYPNKDGRIANGVGLDTPASCIKILEALQQGGYTVTDLPATGDELIRRLTGGITNDPESYMSRPSYQSLSIEEYQQYWQTLPNIVQQGITERWGEIGSKGDSSSHIKIPGIQLGNVFVGIQPSRGYDRDPSLNYHAPDLEPTHEYLAYYHWLRNCFGVQAIVHVGKHGNLEWLPGKSLALSNSCYPEVALQAIPNIYPFIVNDPGEGSQAKRRSQAIIIDHLTPPLTRAELYDGLEKLEALIDEYYEAQSLDPTRLAIISDRITQLVKQENLDEDLGIQPHDTLSLAQFLSVADGYLCELKEAQIRDGLHIFGQCPQKEQLRDLIIAIARSPSYDRIGITQAIAKDFGLDFDPLLGFDGEIGRLGNKTTGRQGNWGDGYRQQLQKARNKGDAIAILEEIAIELVDKVINSPSPFPFALSPLLKNQIQWIQNTLLPNLIKSDREIINLIKALNGEYIPSGGSGAPTRGRPEVLPTGRNFYSVDIRGIPTETAWEVGSKAAQAVIERYTQENGEYPQSLAISIWGTSTMRTGGDDIAQVMALMGVRPVWDGISRRVIDFEVLPASLLNRPRVDVTVRISGFFRDSFPNIINLLNKVTQAVANLPESAEVNPLSAAVRIEQQLLEDRGIDPETAQKKASYRIFGSKPGAYGAGIQGLIEAQNWQSDADLARAYLNWSSYAYDSTGRGYAVPESFQRRLKQLQIVLHNQDNREHDLLDSDDYYQFQGGMTAAVRSLTGKNPEVYFGDNSQPANPRVRKLTEEIARVYRSRVVNPKWIKGVMRHGYKGAFEMAATVDYLFAYDATANCVADYMYQGVAQAYIFDPEVQEFIQHKNPWALRDMSERLLEAHQRGLWQNVDSQIIDDLKAIANQAEGEIEEI
ncbi:cobaltochelatase subunit CobN [Waterburya agarophytonicola K14]|uniref:Cobaltochelatase subunit CobN n=1 Tax=Waterburya agarophytonicola KI4 TaxID=2874699 RepID=A0A964BL80_9CYAN|nr:cobaltochelatase subunit CobN [Waterburya agarophytonicola]MCC0175440.1 cobaltochelatase subunit CobN [Waterburya agarophytonicola KI4]